MARRIIQLVLLSRASWIVTLCAVVSNGFGQFVNLSNLDSNNPIYIWDVDSAMRKLAPAGTSFAQVLGRRAGSSGEFQVVTSSTGRSTFEMAGAGVFDGGIGPVPGVTGGADAEIVIRAWHGASTWDQARSNTPAFLGQSPVFVNPTEKERPIPEAQNSSPLNAPSFTMYPLPMVCRLVDFVGPKPFCFAIRPSPEGLRLEWTDLWTDLGTNYVFTLETNNSIKDTNWVAVAGSWPSRTNQWLIPTSSEASRFYRVKAELRP